MSLDHIRAEHVTLFPLLVKAIWKHDFFRSYKSPRQAICGLGPAVVPHLVGLLDDPGYRKNVCWILQWMGANAAAARTKLHELAGKEPVDTDVLRALSSVDPESLETARVVLGWIGDKTHSDALFLLARLAPYSTAATDRLFAAARQNSDAVRQIRYLPIDYLAANRKRVEALLRLSYMGTRIEACKVLAHLGEKAVASVPALAGLLRERYPELRKAAIDALREIGRGADEAVSVLRTVPPDDRFYPEAQAAIEQVRETR